MNWKHQYWSLSVMLAVATGWLSGCQTTPHPSSAPDDAPEGGASLVCIDHDGDGFGAHCRAGNDCDDSDATITTQCLACTHDGQVGCACATESAVADCGKVVAQVQGFTTCASGESTCQSGHWTECIPNGRTVRSIPPRKDALGLAGAAPCVGNVCDPYCQQFPDTPDKSLSTPTIVGSDGGLTLQAADSAAPVVLPNGPMPDYVQAALSDAGLAADAAPDAVVYHELPPPSTSTDTITATSPAERPVDVYFLASGTSVAANATVALQKAATDPGGIVDQVRAALPNAWFGVGAYQNYDVQPWKATDDPAYVRRHVLSMSPERAELDPAFQWIADNLTATGLAPQSWLPALYATWADAGVPGGHVVARAYWSSPESGESGPCPSGRIGYPCFRPTALPITVISAVAPSNNGPGGGFAYARGADQAIPAAASWASAPSVVVSQNNSESTARSIDVGTFAIYTGNTSTDGAANQNWKWADTDDCLTNLGTAARNVYFTFTVSARTWYHFDTVDSQFAPAAGRTEVGTLLYLYRAGGAGVACNHQHFAGKLGESSLDGVLDPGTYFLVVDGYYGSEGQYLLHVNAMPDSPSNVPPAVPNYAEALNAYQSLGGKVVGIDASSYGCDDGIISKFLQTETANQLEKLAVDTGSNSGAGSPLVVHMDRQGDRCHAADAPIAKQVADAILDLGHARTTITAVAVDVDDASDFDGPPSGTHVLTPVNIDDATFVQSFAAVPTAQTNANCLQTLADRFVDCLPGTVATFSAKLGTPSTVTARDQAQIFTFVIRALSGGATILSETPVVVVVPGSAPQSYASAWFVRDYDTTDVCPKGTSPLWSTWAWTASTPTDSQIDFDVAVAPTQAGLDSAPHDPLLFSVSPGPAALVGQPIGVNRGLNQGAPNTQLGAAVIDATLAAQMRPRDSRFLRMRAHLVPSSNSQQTPKLINWNLQISCQPAE